MDDGDEEFNSVPFEEFGGDGVDYSSHFDTGQKWDNLDEAVRWAKALAQTFGFTLNRSSHKRSRNVTEPTMLHLRCSRGERYRGKLIDLDDEIGRRSSTKTCQCPFLIKVKRHAPGYPWYILVKSGIHGTHNHKMFVYKEGFSHAVVLPEEVDRLIEKMTDAGSKPAFILNAIRNEFPDVKVNINQIYNRRSKRRRLEIGDRSPLQYALDVAISLKYQTWTACDSTTNDLSHIFFAHQTSINLVRTFPYVVLIDTTYKTNTYQWPVCEIVGVTPTNHNFLIAIVVMNSEIIPSYVWVIERLKNLIGDKVQPNVFITDADRGLAGALKIVYPLVPHMLCVWHIGNDVELRISKLTGGKSEGIGQVFRKGPWNNLVYSTTKEEYKATYDHIRNDWYTKYTGIEHYLEMTWLHMKEKFVHLWTNQITHFDNVATSRVESQHSSLKYHLGTSKDAINTFFKRVNGMVENQHNKIRRHLEISRSKIQGSNRGPMWGNLIYNVTHRCMDLIEVEWIKFQSVREAVYNVCGCRAKDVLGIPCACKFADMVLEGQQMIYLDQVHKFWRCLEIGDGVDTPNFDCDDRDDIDRARWRAITDRINNDHDISVMRYCTQILENTLDPHDISEPEGSPVRKGPSYSRAI